MDLLFVYGTLLPECNLSISTQFLKEAEFLGHGYVFAKLYDLGDYPAMVLDITHEHKVFGQIYRLHSPKKTLAILDDYEDINPSFPEDNEYIRAVVKVNSKEIEMNAYAYLYTKDVLPLKKIPSGNYLSYLTDK
ncbi:MAG: gamma-glutamylcyclotransferase [Saprospiraceae bacterium]|nr:gamma-glutamylcyclotransferase [Saprospiraceae bacterium]MDP4816070.1 gamma-glutamylcyclotransferase [Saprospiraceae bacterium]MDP5047440.1 gamma-glutamylcyclotransferase [Saprospiraceae bacterium]